MEVVEATMRRPIGMTTVLKWAYRSYRLEVDEFDSIEEAVASARYCGDSGLEALQCLEVIDGESRRLITAEEVWKLALPIRAAAQEKREEPQLIIRIISPDGGTANEWWSNDLAKTNERVAWWLEVVGPGRVSVMPPPDSPPTPSC